MTDEKQISRANLAGEAIRREDGVGNAIECIYRDLEYAKTLIPNKADPNAVDGDDEQEPRSPTKKLHSLISRTRTVVSPGHGGGSGREEEPTSPPNGSSDEWDVLSNGTTSPRTSAARSPSRSARGTNAGRSAVLAEHEGHPDGGITCGLDNQPDGRVAASGGQVNAEMDEQAKDGKAGGLASRFVKALPGVMTGIPGKRAPAQ